MSSAPGYFQSIVEDITRDLARIAVYLDDILVSGSTADEHLQNFRKLSDWLTAKEIYGSFLNVFSERYTKRI